MATSAHTKDEFKLHSGINIRGADENSCSDTREGIDYRNCIEKVKNNSV